MFLYGFGRRTRRDGSGSTPPALHQIRQNPFRGKLCLGKISGRICGAGGGGGLHHPHTPLHSGGLRPPDPPKKRSPPLAAAVARFFATEPLVRGSCAAIDSILFPEFRLFFFEQATCRGQLRCLGQIIFQASDFFEEATCPGQLRCLGQNFSKKSDIF